MALSKDGIEAAAEREWEFHPMSLKGAMITAWGRRAVTLHDAIDEVNALRRELDDLKEAIATRPF